MSKIDTTYWKEFRVGMFFDFKRGKVKKLQSLQKGDVPVIAAARSNQGVAGCYDVEPLYKEQLTISCNGVGCGSTFYHDYPFNVNGDAIVSSDKMFIPTKAKQFICCILDGLLTRKYSYEEKCSPKKASNEKILLPATPNGEPDWRYMEMYMRGVEAIAKEKIALLTKKKQEPVQQQTSITNYGTVNIYEK